MLRPVAYVTITKSDGSQTVFNWINYIEISKSYEHLTGTAKVILPKRITDTGLELFSGALPIFERGDNVLIEGGYFPNRYTLFEGFVSKVSARIPVEIDCEDYMYLFKQFKFTYPPPSSITIQKFSKTGKSLKQSAVAGQAEMAAQETQKQEARVARDTQKQEERAARDAAKEQRQATAAAATAGGTAGSGGGGGAGADPLDTGVGDDGGVLADGERLEPVRALHRDVHHLQRVRHRRDPAQDRDRHPAGAWRDTRADPLAVPW